MYTSCLIISLVFLIPRVFTIPTAQDVSSKRALNSTSLSAINATITDHAGHDITSSFQIRLYNPEVSAQNASNGTLSNRQVDGFRYLDECPPGQGFERSFCTRNKKAGSMQSYRIECQKFYYLWGGRRVSVEEFHRLFNEMLTGSYGPDRSGLQRQPPSMRYNIVPRDRHCPQDHICVDGKRRHKLGFLGNQGNADGWRDTRQEASCVPTNFFVEYIQWGKRDQKGLNLEGKTASMVASQLNGTPIEVDTFEADTETANGDTTQTKRCRDCMELQTDPFRADIESLQFGTRLLTTGAMAGVLWLAIASG